MCSVLVQQNVIPTRFFQNRWDKIQCVLLHPSAPPLQKKKEIKPKHFCLDKATVSCTFRRGMRIVAPLDSNVTSVSVPGETGSAYITEQNFGTFVVFRF